MKIFFFLFCFLHVFFDFVKNLQFNIGIVHSAQSMTWQNVRYAIDEWNAINSVSKNLTFNLIAPTDLFASADARFCDIIQRKLIAIIVPYFDLKLYSSSEFLIEKDNSQISTQSDMFLVLSMCKQFKIPCIIDNYLNSLSDLNFVVNVGLDKGVIGKALSELILHSMWNQFLIVYNKPKDLIEIADLLSIWKALNGVSVTIKLLQLPSELIYYDAFLKNIRERLRITKIIVHTYDLSIIHTILIRANRLNMTESKYSYIFTHPDLFLLEDFFNKNDNVYNCNISGIQLFSENAFFYAKTDLALVIRAINLIGNSLQNLNSKNLLPSTETLLCDAEDVWRDGDFFFDNLRKSKVLLNDIKNYNYFQNNKMSYLFNQKNNNVVLNLVAITRTREKKFKKIAQWNQTHLKWNFEEKHQERWKFNGDYPNLSGEKLRVVIYLEEPFVMRKISFKEDSNNYIEEDNEKFKNKKTYQSFGPSQNLLYEGFCIDLLNEMAAILNFTFEVIEVEDGTYGVEDENGIWNGIIGVLQRQEADLSVSALTITYNRVSVIDFTLPFMHLGISILVAKNNEDHLQKQNNTFFTFLEPLSFSVWVALVVAYFSIGLALCFLAKISPFEWFNEEDKPSTNEKKIYKFRKSYKYKNQFNLLNSLWFAVASLMHQGSDVIPRAAATRALALFWWMFTLILISTYTAQLAAFLTVERMSTSIENAADLTSQERIKFGTLSNGSTMDFFRESNIPIYERMWSIMQATSPTVFVNSSKEGIARVKAGNYAYMMESSMLEYYISSDCEIQTVGGLLDSKGYGVATPKGSPLRNVFSQAILKLQELTILEALKDKWWHSNVRKKDCTQKKYTHSSLYRIFGIFYVLYGGIIISILVAIGEYCIESKNRSIRMQLTFLNQFFLWINSLWISHKNKLIRRAKHNGLEITEQRYGSTHCNIASNELNYTKKLENFDTSQFSNCVVERKNFCAKNKYNCIQDQNNALQKKILNFASEFSSESSSKNLQFINSDISDKNVCNEHKPYCNVLSNKKIYI